MKRRSDCDVREWIAPIEPRLAEALVAFLGHKGRPWIDDIQLRLATRLPGVEDHFYVACEGGRIVGHAWYTVAQADPRLGLVGHIYTDPEFRRRGIAADLLERVMRDFCTRGGQAMQLFTSTPFSVPFYERLGFENLFASSVYHDTDWYMRYPSGSGQTLASWFHATNVSMRRLRLADLPQYCLLYNWEHRQVIKDRAQRVGLGLEAELAFIETHQAVAQGRAHCCVLENGETIVGTASLLREAFPYQSHVAIFDFYLHEAFGTSLPALVEACLASRGDLGVEVAYALGSDPEKCSALSDLGFAHVATLADYFRIGGERLDCQLFRFE